MAERIFKPEDRSTAGRPIWRSVAVGLLLLFVLALARFLAPGLGFTSLLSIGAKLGKTTVPALAAVPHHVYEDSHGYDGAYYVQIALDPLLRSAELPGAIDNLHYRAKRILMSWVAWTLGAGQPAWVVHVFPLLNIACWIALAFLLWRWLPPDNPQNLLRWAGVLFSHGACMSVRHSLVDLPSLLAVAVAVAWWERRRTAGAKVALAAAVLTKETSVLAGLLFAAPPAIGRRWWLGNAAALAVIVAPLALWMTYLHVRFGAPPSPGFNNFTLPLAGWVGKWREIHDGVRQDGWLPLHATTLLAVVALTVQAAFLLARWRPGEVWWRVGLGSAVLFLFISQPVWEGHPGAATRVLLPMTLAFNLLVPRGRAWLAVLVAGNLSVFASVAEFKPPVRDFLTVEGEPALVAGVELRRGDGWHQAESDLHRAWRWARQRAVLRVDNRTGAAIELRLAAEFSGLRPCRLVVRAPDGDAVFDEALAVRGRRGESAPFVVPPGPAEIVFASDRPETRLPNGDPRAMSFSVGDLRITVAPAGGRTQR